LIVEVIPGLRVFAGTARGFGANVIPEGPLLVESETLAPLFEVR